MHREERDEPDLKPEAPRTFGRSPGIVSRKIVGETILVPVSNRLANLQRVFALNPVAEHVWEQIDGTRTLGQIRDSVVETFDVGAPQAERDLDDLITELLAEGLIEERK